MKTNPSTKKILETIKNENKNSESDEIWKKFYEYNGNGSDSHPFIVFFRCF